MKKLMIILCCILLAGLLAGCRAGSSPPVQSGTASFSNGEICGAPEVKY